MDHNELQLITNLADRLRTAPPVVKDPQAAEAIQRLIASQPDAVYVLTQAVLIQEVALQNAQAKIAEQSNQLAEQQPTEQGGGGFFGSLFGKPAQSSPAGAPGAGAGGGYPQAPAAPQQQGGNGGGFLATAAAAAVGVAGGALLFEGLSDVFGDDHESTAAEDAGDGLGFDDLDDEW